MDLIRLENVTKMYGEKALFLNIDLRINRGQKVALVAKNGAGKSTLLRVMAGLEQPEGETAGVRLHRDIRLGYLPQEPELFDRHSVLDAVLDADTPLGAAAAALYAQFVEDEDGRGRDFSAMLPRFEGRKRGD